MKLLQKVKNKKHGRGTTTVQGGASHLGRSYEDIHKACDIKNCMRPSSYTVMTIAKFDVDIPGATGSLIRNEERLPTYKWYQICDRCYRDKVSRVTGHKLVLGPKHSYSFDNDDKTQKKLAKLSWWQKRKVLA